MSHTLPNGTEDPAAAAARHNDKSADHSREVTNQTIPKQNRGKRLVKSAASTNPLKYEVWLAGHSVSIVFGTISLACQLFWFNRYYIGSISYKLSLLGSIVALASTLSHKFGLHFLPPATTILVQQNFQYLALAITWVFTFKSVVKLLPYYIISILQLGSHKKISFINKQETFLASVIAYDELVLIVYLLLRTLFFRNTSGYQLSLFLIFYWLRILYNKETGNLFRAIVLRLDGKVTSIKNPKVQHFWTRIKEILKEKQTDQLQYT